MIVHETTWPSNPLFTGRFDLGGNQWGRDWERYEVLVRDYPAASRCIQLGDLMARQITDAMSASGRQQAFLPARRKPAALRIIITAPPLPHYHTSIRPPPLPPLPPPPLTPP